MTAEKVAEAGVEDVVLRAEAARRDALLHGDVPALRRLIRPDAIFVHATGHRSTGAQWLDEFENAQFSYDAMTVSEEHVLVVGHVGAVSFGLRSGIRFGGELHDSHTQSTSVWTVNERPELILFQTTFIAH